MLKALSLPSGLEDYFRNARYDGCGALPLEETLHDLVELQFDRLPLNGSGRTLERWQALATVAGHDLALAKLYEGHTDALAIMAELGAGAETVDGTWGMWAAEPPDARVEAGPAGRCGAELDGRKAWCSGAPVLSHALITAWEDGQQRLYAVALEQPGVEITDSGWQAIGMARTGSVDVRFDGALATPVGPAGAYQTRAGFWQGGAGIAACWYGAAAAIGESLRAAVAARPHPHTEAHLGMVDAALAAARATLRETAAHYDNSADRQQDRRLAMRARAAVEHAAAIVIDHAGRALGAPAYCKDARLAQLLTDLPVYLRQSHAEFDLAALGRSVASADHMDWRL
jgi:alkylation response protein AidB-like acyl-CoA dehydrogenase